MPSLFENAISSIRMGFEDFKQQDADRDISAVRNFYAGVLLLAKEAIIRAAPKADPAVVIGAKVKPVPDGMGGVEMKQIGQSTVDFNQIAERAKDFNISLDQSALKSLNKLRNDMEHHYTSETSNSIREAISRGFPVVASLLRQMEEDPVELLEEVWAGMLETKVLYDHQLAEARATLEHVKWFSPSINERSFRCDDCQSELIEQVEPANQSQHLVELRCKTCGAFHDIDEAVENAVERLFGADTYIRAKETGENGPVYTCPACGRDTLLEEEGGCASCGEALDYTSQCIRCGEGISIQDFLDGIDEGLCSYCSYVSEKAMRD
ncbi:MULTISPECIES: hypothetical protein [Sphingomonas]|uniref:hypothetical protein n=1 Tax=Sphingomonas TaxID=13687 RepID=UPI000F7E5ABC|nr:hypothetical protein [Sphingomonas sp. ABOLF]RSV14613.1 hypothetical protein CA235_11075 [Sphingomonas sp. ABOLF]GLK19211.1 hypothetical protein GCM10017606_00370 [Microbacterium terregens]